MCLNYDYLWLLRNVSISLSVLISHSLVYINENKKITKKNEENCDIMTASP